MHETRIRDRIAEAKAAARLLSDLPGVLALAAEALGAACPRGFALAFTRRSDGRFGAAAAMRGGALLLPPGSAAPERPLPWIVNVDAVPAWQQNRWIEPIRAGLHGPDYFLKTNPLPMRLMQARRAPQYGRMMLCRHDRMVAWLGVYVDDPEGFADGERAALARVAAELAAPLRAAALLDDIAASAALAPRQRAILARVARGWSNKQIAADLAIAPATVKTVLERLYDASGAPNRAALVRWWLAGGNPPR
jgi:DNA-binding CsgD family transcriptional regulator